MYIYFILFQSLVYKRNSFREASRIFSRRISKVYVDLYGVFRFEFILNFEEYEFFEIYSENLEKIRSFLRVSYFHLYFFIIFKILNFYVFFI